MREIWLAENRAAAEAARTIFAAKYTPKYDRAVDCLLKDRDALLTFFDFLAEHWTHLRTSNPIESAFATVWHRTVRMKGALSQDTTRLMVFMLIIGGGEKLVTTARTKPVAEGRQLRNIPRRHRSRKR